MFSIRREHEYLVCMDSDGTIMDTMTSKHRLAIGPAFIQAFGINEHRDEILEEWVRLNCFSQKRGYNRFLTLDIMLSYVKKFGYVYPGTEEYHEWTLHTESLSIPSALEAAGKASSPETLKLAAAWSKLCNEKIEGLPKAKPFALSSWAVHETAKKADLLGVSTANKQALRTEWTNAGIIDCFKVVASQEYGTKESVLKTAVAEGYDPFKCVMVGDSFGDLHAAEAAGIRFYPMIPNHEDESWKEFIETALPRLLSGTFDDSYQEELIQSYKNSLGH